MKRINSLIRSIFLLIVTLFVTGCVHDDVYNAPNLSKYQCEDLKGTLSIAQVKALYTGTTYVFPETSTDILEGYVSSSDETGNVYKTLYIQDAPSNPTQGFTISLNAVSTYTNFPQGAKVYIKLKGLAIGTYGGLIQLGVKDLAPGASTNGVARIPEDKVASHISRSCTVMTKIVPKVITLSQLGSSSIDPYIGCLVQVNNAEFSNKILCNTYAAPNTSVDRQIVDATMPSGSSSRVVRNSGYASFAQDLLPSGNGTFVGILSKFNTTYQFYINRSSDLNMKAARLDGLAAPCTYDTSVAKAKTIAEVKSLLSGSLTQITGDFYVKATVTANDETGNLYKYFYVEDSTGGIRVNINMLSLYQDPRFMVGREVLINLKNLYVGNVNGEIQLGGLNGSVVGWISDADIYKQIFNTGSPLSSIVPTEKTITSLTTSDVGRWIKIKDLQFVSNDLGKSYSLSGSATTRTLEDCAGNKLFLRTSNFATFATEEVYGGKGDVYGILSIFNGNYQLWITNLLGTDFKNPRCDGSTPDDIIYKEEFTIPFPNSNWSVYNVVGTQKWNTANYGNPAPCALVSGFSGSNQATDSWLISRPISLQGLSTASLSFINDKRYTGNNIEVKISENYVIGQDPNTATWITLTPYLDSTTNQNNWVFSDKLSLNAFLNKNIIIAFRYTSTTSAASTWEIDNVTVKGKK